MKTQDLRQRIESDLKKLALKQRGNTQTWTGEYFNSDDANMICLRLKTPLVRKLADSHRQELEEAVPSREKRFQMLQSVWQSSKIFEAKSITLYWLEEQTNEWLTENSNLIIKWVEYVNNWAHSDTYAGVLARIFETDPKRLTPIYKQWNKHQNPWKRRNSMVGLMLYSRMRKRLPSFSLCQQLVHTQITAPEYYVQKGYGWTLREMFNVYPERTFQYLEKHADRISPAAWYAATEKLKLKEKKYLMNLRKTRTQS